MKEKNDYISIGKRIKNARINASLTQYQLHNLTEISITQISAYENGKRNIGLSSLKKIANATGTTIDELYNGKYEDKIINETINEGKLIINCITALFEKNVITGLISIKENQNRLPGKKYYYHIGFNKYKNILDDYINKLIDYEKDKHNYPNPEEFKRQLIEASSKKINDQILSEK